MTNNNKNNNFAVIMGAMKCGTTSLFYYLAEHPEIAPAKDKEPHFFAYKKKYESPIENYYKLWDWEAENTVALEASTTYTMHPKYGDVAARIAAVDDANFKFIYILRHPFKRIESHIRHLISEGFQNKVEVIEEHLAFTEYARQLDFYRDKFGRDRIYVLLLENLQANPKEELRSICQFLEIDPDYEFQRLDVVRNSKDTLNLHPALRKIYKIPLVKSLGSLISPEIRQKLYQPLSRKQTLEVKLSDEEKAQVLQRLEPDLMRLQDEYGVDISKWGLLLNV